MRKSSYTKVVHYRKQRADTEIILYSDLKINNSGGFLNELGIVDKTIYKEKPATCSDCNSKLVIGLEVLGAKDGILFWICDDCENLHLKYSESYTERCIEVSKGFWTYNNAWPIPPQSQFN